MFTTLRLIHIIAGIFVGGTYLFLVLILEPRLKRLGPAIQGPVMRAITPVLTPLMALSFILLFGTGTAMIFLIREGNLSQLVTTGWGLVILTGIIATIVVSIIGFGIIMPTGIRMGKLGQSIEGRAPTPEEGQRLHQLSERITKLSRINFIFVVIAIATMVISQYL